MKTQEATNFSRIEEAITYINDNYTNQPSLEQIAEKVHLSPFHFQKLFTDWAGVSPKKFLQFITINHAKTMLDNKASLLATAYDTGLSGTGRLHDMFVKIEGMTPGEYKNGGASLVINYTYAPTRFGNIIVAATPKGICHIAFAEDESGGFHALQNRFPNATYRESQDDMQQQALRFFSDDWDKPGNIKLHLKGTAFQVKVWEALLKIPTGGLSTYGSIATRIEAPKASRAVGTAIGDNPVAYLIPCHRVIQASGKFGQYHWGASRKTAMIGWEAAHTYPGDK